MECQQANAANIWCDIKKHPFIRVCISKIMLILSFQAL